MTKIDFYQIESEEDPLFFTCRLIEKVYRRGHRIYVHTQDNNSATRLDDLLWTFRPDRFVPHHLQANATPAGEPTGQLNDEASPVRIGHDFEPSGHQDVLVNLSGHVPDFFSRFERVAEVVPMDENRREAARTNYRFYKERGYPLDYHRMTAKG